MCGGGVGLCGPQAVPHQAAADVRRDRGLRARGGADDRRTLPVHPLSLDSLHYNMDSLDSLHSLDFTRFPPLLLYYMVGPEVGLPFLEAPFLDATERLRKLDWPLWRKAGKGTNGYIYVYIYIYIYI